MPVVKWHVSTNNILCIYSFVIQRCLNEYTVFARGKTNCRKLLIVQKCEWHITMPSINPANIILSIINKSCTLFRGKKTGKENKYICSEQRYKYLRMCFCWNNFCCVCCWLYFLLWSPGWLWKRVLALLNSFAIILRISLRNEWTWHVDNNVKRNL